MAQWEKFPKKYMPETCELQDQDYGALVTIWVMMIITTIHQTLSCFSLVSFQKFLPVNLRADVQFFPSSMLLRFNLLILRAMQLIVEHKLIKCWTPKVFAVALVLNAFITNKRG